MKRRELFKKVGLATESILGGHSMRTQGEPNSERVLRIAHITDSHIQPEDNIPDRFRKCLEEIKTKNVDFILNGGDSIMEANTKGVTRERVNELWASWNEVILPMRCSFEIYSCLGARDLWEEEVPKEDQMYGRDYAAKQLKMPSKYYAFQKKNWHFIILDHIGSGDIDGTQRGWLDNYLKKLRAKTPVIIMCHFPILSSTVYVNSPFIYGEKINWDPGGFINFLHGHRDKKIHFISGYFHLKETAVYNGIKYYCNGAMSGFWWGAGDKESVGKGYYKQTPPGYAILDLYDDGTLVNEYIPHSY